MVDEVAKGTGGGKVLFTNKVELVVKEQNVGEFTVKKSGNTWLTPVEIQEGKVLLRFGNAEHLFTYDEKGKKAILSVSYDSEGSGRKRQNKVVL